MLMERPGLMVRLLASPEPTVKRAATAAQADRLESAEQRVARELQLAQTASPATAVTRASVGRVAAVPPVRMGRLYLQTVRPAEPVVMAVRAA